MTGEDVILALLRAGPAYGMQLAELARDRTDGAVTLSQGTLHHALKSLQAAGLIRCYEAPGPHGGRPRRYSELTAKGRRKAVAARTAAAALWDLYETPNPG